MTRNTRFGDWTFQNPDWTPQRAQVLKVLAVHGIARVSAIFETGMMPPTVFRETAVWVAGRGLIEIENDGLASTARLTDSGRAFVAVLDQKARA